MAIFKRRNQDDHEFPAPKRLRTSPTFTIDEFMADFPPTDKPPADIKDPPLPLTVLTQDEMQDGSRRKPPRRSTFNVKLPVQLDDHDNAPYDWMKKQYSHCVIPELGEEYNFELETPTFHTLRDLHNARVRLRDGEVVTDYQIVSLATRWIQLQEKDRPTSDGYLANGEIFVATCLPLSDREDALRKYFELTYPNELSARRYIPLSKYSVHFVGEPIQDADDKIRAVDVASVLIRNTRTGQLVHIDTGPPTGRKTRAAAAGDALSSWLEFQKEKRPGADLGPISASQPLVLDVDRETRPSLRAIHALVSASLFFRRRIKNWGNMKAFQRKTGPDSTRLETWALHNISGWLGLKTPEKPQAVRRKGEQGRIHSFEDNYQNDGLYGREYRVPLTYRIGNAKKGEPPLYNEDDSVAGDDSDDEDGGNSVLSSEHSLDSDQETVVAAEPSNGKELLDNEESDGAESNSEGEEPVNKESTNKEITSQENGHGDTGHDDADQDDTVHGDISVEDPNPEGTSNIDEGPNHEVPSPEGSISKEPKSNEFKSTEPKDEQANANDEQASSGDPSDEDINSEKSNEDGDDDKGEGDNSGSAGSDDARPSPPATV